MTYYIEYIKYQPHLFFCPCTCLLLDDILLLLYSKAYMSITCEFSFCNIVYKLICKVHKIHFTTFL